MPIAPATLTFVCLAGLAASALFDLPSGAVIVWSMALLALPVFALAGRGGGTGDTAVR